MIIAGMVGRHLGTELYGILGLGSAVVAIGTALAQLGFETIVVRETVKNPAMSSALLGAAFLARALVGGAFVAGLYVVQTLFAWTAPESFTVILVLSLAVFAPAITVPSLWFQSRTQSRVVAVSGLLTLVVASAIRYWLTTRPPNALAFAWVSVGEIGVHASIVFLLMKKAGGVIMFQSALLRVGQLVRMSLPVWLSSIVTALYMKLDVLLLAEMMGTEAVGLYNAATRLSDAAYAVPGLLAISMTATLSSGVTEKSVRDFFGLSAALGYLLFFSGLLVAPLLLRLLFGSEFHGIGLISQVHLLSVLFLSMNVARGRVLVAEKLEFYALYCSMVGIVAAAVFGYVLISLWGVMGAALAVVATHATAGVGATFLFRRTRALGRVQVRTLMKPMLSQLWGLRGNHLR